MLLKLTGYAPAQRVAQTFAGRKSEPQISPSQKKDKVELTFGSLSLKDINVTQSVYPSLRVFTNLQGVV